MLVYWPQALLFASVVGFPFGELAFSNPNKGCIQRELATRAADPAIIPVLPFPKPIVPPIIPGPILPKPIAPKPVTPRPVGPAPLPPRPIDPGHLAGGRCKRAPGDACSNISPFQNTELELVRAKGRDAQASLLATQRANPLPHDVDRVAVSTKYSHNEVKDMAPPLDKEDSSFLAQGGAQVSYSHANTWTKYSTRNHPGVNEKIDNNILETYVSTKDRGIVISESRNKENDLLAAQDKLPWSDMVMNDIRTAFSANKINPDELQYMLRSNIQTESSALKTRGYIEDAIARTAGNRANVNTFRSDPNAPGMTTDELAAYQLLAGSDHVHRVLLMLRDYPTSMRNIRIDSLSVTTPDVADAEAYHILIKFAKMTAP